MLHAEDAKVTERFNTAGGRATHLYLEPQWNAVGVMVLGYDGDAAQGVLSACGDVQEEMCLRWRPGWEGNPDQRQGRVK